MDGYQKIRKGQNVEQTHPDLFKAINASVADKVYDKRLEEAREKQKILDEILNSKWGADFITGLTKNAPTRPMMAWVCNWVSRPLSVLPVQTAVA